MSLEFENLDLSQYSIVKPIGNGAYSNFYVIKENQSGKIYRAEISKYRITKNVKEVNSFCEKEIQKIFPLNHPSILKIIGFSCKDFNLMNKPTTITEYFSVHNLAELADKKKSGQSRAKWDDTEKLICIYGIASAMEFSHKNGVIHGDLKPESILIDDSCHPKIIYSKFLKKVNEQNTFRDEFDDTTFCVLSGLITDNSSTKEEDVFAFSLILYLILNGHKINSKKQNNSIKFRRDVSQPFRELFKKCNSGNPEERPTFEEITASLRNNEKFITEKVDSKKFFEYVNSINSDGALASTKQSPEKGKQIKRVSSAVPPKSDKLEHGSSEVISKSDKIKRGSSQVSHKSDQTKHVSSEVNYTSDEISHASTEMSYISDETSYLSEENIHQNDDRDDDDGYVEEVKKNSSICKVCQKEMKKQTDIYYYHGIPYHSNCIRCRICHKNLIPVKSDKNKEEEEEEEEERKLLSDDLVCVVPGMFFCRDHFEEYKNQRKPLPRDIQIEYVNKMVKNGIDKLFGPYEDDPNALPLNKYFKLFVPSVTFHFSNSPSQIDFKELVKKFPKDFIIIYIERGSTFLTIAFIASGMVPKTEKKFKEIIQPLKQFFNSAAGKSIIGVDANEPEFNFSDQDKIKSFFKRGSINILHLEDVLNEIDFSKIKDEVNKRLKTKLDKSNWDLIFSNQNLYNEAEEAVRQEIENNEVDLIVTGITIIANERFGTFKDDANKLSNKVELFLYHGTQISNHLNIGKKSFLLPSEAEKEGIKLNDDGWFGKGIYATDNIFYALMYSSSNHKIYLEVDDENSVICCKAMYNSEFLEYLNNLKNSVIYNEGTIFRGNEMDDKIINNNGVHKILVESETRFHPIGINGCFYRRPRTTKKHRPSFVSAHEYVFPKSKQIIPVFSLSIKRPKYFILWLNEKDENEYSNYLKDLRFKAEINIYYKQTIDEAFKLVDKKVRNKMKLIISIENKDSCRDFINRARDCHQKNFIILIFSKERSFTELSSEMENVIFTDEFEILDQFMKMPLEKEPMFNFCKELNSKYENKFNINENQLTAFHQNIWF